MHRCNYVEAVCTGILVVCLGGCGTIIHGRDQTLHISSTPQGAEVLYDGAVQVIINENEIATVHVGMAQWRRFGDDSPVSLMRASI